MAGGETAGYAPNGSVLPSIPRSKSAPPGVGSHAVLVPVEFKLGKRKQWRNDDVQLCAQALCLEEMFECRVETGAVFHADSKRRRDVVFTPELREQTTAAAEQLHALLASEVPPPAVYRNGCEECSLFDICLPKATGSQGRAERLARQLFQT